MPPFEYPTKPHDRRHGPDGYKQYKTYKRWLRDEFVFRCVYCLSQEVWYPNRNHAFGVEHFYPKSVKPNLVCDYSNLLYACNRCNTLRNDEILPDDLHPEHYPYGVHLSLEQDATWKGLNTSGDTLIELFGLNDEEFVGERLDQIKMWSDMSLRRNRVHTTCGRFSLPLKMPDLSKRRPPRDLKPGSDLTSYALRYPV